MRRNFGTLSMPTRAVSVPQTPRTPQQSAQFSVIPQVFLYSLFNKLAIVKATRVARENNTRVSLYTQRKTETIESQTK